MTKKKKLKIEKRTVPIKTAFGDFLSEEFGKPLGLPVTETEEQYRVEGCKKWRCNLDEAAAAAGRKFKRKVTVKDLDY